MTYRRLKKSRRLWSRSQAALACQSRRRQRLPRRARVEEKRQKTKISLVEIEKAPAPESARRFQRFQVTRVLNCLASSAIWRACVSLRELLEQGMDRAPSVPHAEPESLKGRQLHPAQLP